MPHSALFFSHSVFKCFSFLALIIFWFFVFLSALMTGRHSAMSWKQWSRISWRRARRPRACWLCSRSQTSWPPACPPCILRHHKEAWRRSTWVSREEKECVCVCVWLFDLNFTMSVLIMSNAPHVKVNFWTKSLVGVDGSYFTPYRALDVSISALLVSRSSHYYFSASFI